MILDLLPGQSLGQFRLGSSLSQNLALVSGNDAFARVVRLVVLYCMHQN